jgi:predicted component of type VI protein secretion system
MRMILKMAALATCAGCCCSCSWFGGKPVEATNRVDATLNQAQQVQQMSAQQVRQVQDSAERLQQVPQMPAQQMRQWQETADRYQPYQPPPSRAEAVKAAAEAFKKEALTILIKADTQLNRFERNAHALFLCVYQLKDPNGFNQLAQEKDGLPKLLECSRFDGSVANAKQFVVQPGDQMNEVRDRAEGARYIGLATGYYGNGKEKVTELRALLPGGASDPAGAIISIELGPYEISSVKVK